MLDASDYIKHCTAWGVCNADERWMVEAAGAAEEQEEDDGC